MKILLGNFAGAFSNVLKFLTWCLVKKDEDALFFFYANKADNDHPKLIPFQWKHEDVRQNIFEDRHRNIFYKLFEPPAGYTPDDIVNCDTFEMHFPFNIEKGNYEKYQLKAPPDVFVPYIEHSIFTEKLYNDANFDYFRTTYNTLWKQYLIPTPYLQDCIQKDLVAIQAVKAQGKRIVAAFIRSPVHFYSDTNDKSYQFRDILQEVEALLQEYDYVLPITQVKPYYEYLEQAFPGKIIPLSRPRHGEMVDWVALKYTEDEFLNEVRTAIVDVYLASQCDMIIGGLSNLFTSTLFLNPTVPFKVFECLKGKISY